MRRKSRRERSGEAGGEVEAVYVATISMSARRHNGAKGKRTEILSESTKYQAKSSYEHMSAVPDYAISR